MFNKSLNTCICQPNYLIMLTIQGFYNSSNCNTQSVCRDMRQNQITQGKGKTARGKLIDIALPDMVSRDLSCKDRPGPVLHC